MKTDPTEHGLRPLVWVERPAGRWRAAVPMGAYRVERDVVDWSRYWCFDEYYDEGRGVVDTLEEAKEICTKDYVGRFACVVLKQEGNSR